MARNGSGTYSVPNSFAPGETISSSDHNDNFTDLGNEITNSIAADGQTSMSGPLKLPNGSVTAPAWTFASDTNSGGYRIGADNFGLAVGGNKIVDIASTGISITGTLTPSGQILAADGAVSAPGISLASDPNTGLYPIAADRLGIAAGGTKIFDITTTSVSITGTLASSGAMTVTSGGLTVTAGGLTVTAGGLTVSDGAVSLPAASIADAALVAPGGLVLIKTQVASSSATIDFQNGVSGVVLDDTYDDYLLMLSSVVPATNGAQLQMLVGTGATPTYQTANYTNNGFTSQNANAVSNGIGTTSAAFIGLSLASANGVSNTATHGGLKGKVEFSNPESSIQPLFIYSVGYSNGSTNTVGLGGQAGYSSATAMTALRFQFGSGNIASGRFSLYGYKKA